MIIYGYRHKEIEQNTGVFQCPSCGEQRAYKRMKIARYFTLFFIPLFPLGTKGEFVECQVCRRKYQPDILSVVGSFPGTPAGQPSYFPPTEEETAPRNSSCLGTGLLAVGILAMLLACGLALLFTIVQAINPGNWQGFLGVMVLCPMPLVAAGSVMSLVGYGLRRKV
ncbi:MAG: zinc-ribbon domain-containing protein [Chloroflexota bacterium]